MLLSSFAPAWRLWSRVARVGAALSFTAAVGVAEAQTAASEVLRSGAIGMHAQYFAFAPGSDVQRARLELYPFAWQQRVTPRLSLDAYTAYARGSVRAGRSELKLSGPVDSWARMRWAAMRDIVVAVGVNFPTGVERHTAEEAVVSNVLSNDLLGFREGNWGAGASGTFGLSTATRVRGTHFTLGASYRTAGSFQPSVDTTVRFAPGNETRVRLGVNGEVAGGSFEGGMTFQSFRTDKLDQKNLFQSGHRYRADVAYRRGPWSIFAADLYRDRGELILPIVSIVDGSFIRDTVVDIGWQNLAIVGVSTAIGFSRTLILQPSAEFKFRNREERFGRGWIGAVGGVLPFSAGTFDVFPSAKWTFGRLVPAGSDATVARALQGAEIGFIIRRSWRRQATTPLPPLPQNIR